MAGLVGGSSARFVALGWKAPSLSEGCDCVTRNRGIKNASSVDELFSNLQCKSNQGNIKMNLDTSTT